MAVIKTMCISFEVEQHVLLLLVWMECHCDLRIGLMLCLHTFTLESSFQLWEHSKRWQSCQFSPLARTYATWDPECCQFSGISQKVFKMFSPENWFCLNIEKSRERERKRNDLAIIEILVNIYQRYLSHSDFSLIQDVCGPHCTAIHRSDTGLFY